MAVSFGIALRFFGLDTMLHTSEYLARRVHSLRRVLGSFLAGVVSYLAMIAIGMSLELDSYANM